MRSYAFGRLAAVIALGGVSASCLFAQPQQAAFVANPSGALVFDVSTGIVTPKDVAITLSNTGQSTAIFNVTTTPGVSAVVLNDPKTTAPNTIRVTVNPSVLLAGAQGSVNISGTGFNTLSIPVQVVNGTASTTFGVSPTSVSFVQNGAAIPGAATVAVISSNGVIPSYTISGTYNNGTNWLSVSPAPGVPTTSGTVTITPITTGLAPGVYTATIVLSAAGFTPVSIPVSLSIDQAVGTALVVNPTSLTFSGSQNNFQAVTVSSGLTAVGYTVTASQNIASYLAISPAQGTTTSSFQVTVPNPSLVPSGTVGTITVTPTAGSGFTATTIPVTINTAGSTLIVSPSSLSFTGALGSGTNTPKQLLSVTSSDGTQRQFQVTATSTSNFLTVDNNFATTPANISVGVNMSGVTQPGPYVGSLAITPLSGGGPTTFVQVTLNAVQSITVTPDPASVTLSAGAGSNSVQRDVLLNSSVANAPFTATATTTSGQGWLSVTTSAVTLPASITIMANPAGLGTGTYDGSVAVTSQGVTVATIPVTFTVTPAATLQLTPSSLVFNYETSSASVPATQTIQVTSNNNTNIPWTASVASGNWLRVNQTPGTTPGTLSVSVVPTGLTPGPYTGSISVASTGASNSPQTVNVTLNVTTPAIPLITSFQNGASFEQTLAVPGSIITIRGTDLGPTVGLSGQINQGSLATTVGDVEVLFDGIPAPIIYASATQINAVVPYELYGRTATRLQVRYRTQRSRELELRVQDTNPGIFTSNASGTGQAAALNQNNSVNSPSNPEQRGNVIVLYATGMGQTNPGGTTGRIMTGTDLRRPLGMVTVRIGGQTAQVDYAGSAPGLVAGAMQINARIPSNSLIGPNVPVTVQVGNLTSQSNVTIAVQ